jgi:fucose permease
VLSGFGNGLEDGAWNAWIGNMEKANELLGFLHGAYGLGATISPLIATASMLRSGLYRSLSSSFHSCFGRARSIRYLPWETYKSNSDYEG